MPSPLPAAARRYIPPVTNTIDDLRVGPMPWHPVVKYDPTRDRTSECDADYRSCVP